MQAAREPAAAVHTAVSARHRTVSGQRHAAVAELGQAALRGLRLAEVLDLAVGLVSEVLEVDYAKVLQQPAPGEPLVMVAGRGWGPEVRVGDTTVPCEHGSQAGYTLLADEPILVDDLAGDSRFTGPALLLDHQVVSGMSVVVPDQDRPYGVLGVHTRRPRRFTAEEGDFLRSVANIIGSALQNGRARQELVHYATRQERRVQYQAALAECAQALLASSGDDRLVHALEALLVATQATYVFVERNVEDPELGFCSSTVAEVERRGPDPAKRSNEYWDIVPWERMPTSRAHLEKGKPIVIIPEELDGVEYELYAEDPFPIKSELDIPIFVEGEWAGLIGFADSEQRVEWTAEELSLLETAAAMVGAFWEREVTRQRLEQMVRSKDEFLATVSHELRTPLTAVIGFGHMLRDGAEYGLSADERTELLESMLKHGMDVTNIVSDLLTAARADIGTLNVSQVPVDLRAQTAQVLEAFDVDGESVVELSGRAPKVVADPDRVRQIVRNLVSNALRYGGDVVQTEVVDGGGTSSVLVVDDGPPIPEPERERIFERYQRAEGTRAVAVSLGLGLAISRHLARLMGGDLSYRYEDGRSIFELELPQVIRPPEVWIAAR